MVKTGYNWFYRVLFLLLLSGLIACSTEDDDISREGEQEYFIARSDTKTLNRSSLVERLGMEAAGPLLAILPDKQIRVDAIRYRSKDPAGNPLEVSGIISYPADGEFKGVAVGQHFTIGSNREAPSSCMATIESALSLFGYIVIIPDYIGFGSSANLPQTYIHAESIGRNTADMVFAAREYFFTLGYTMDKELDVIGYSQGGYAALAFMKTAEQQYAGKINIRRVFAGGGPYVPDSMFDTFMEMDVMDNVATVPLTVIGLDYGDALHLDYTKIFLEPLLSNYQEWCVSKNYTLGQINSLLGTNRLTDLLHPDFFTPERNDEINKLKASLAANNLIGWKPKAPLLLFHGTKDMTVPFANAQIAYDTFNAAGCPVELRTASAGHEEAAISFYTYILLQTIKES